MKNPPLKVYHRAAVRYLDRLRLASHAKSIPTAALENMLGVLKPGGILASRWPTSGRASMPPVRSLPTSTSRVIIGKGRSNSTCKHFEEKTKQRTNRPENAAAEAPRFFARRTAFITLSQNWTASAEQLWLMWSYPAEALRFEQTSAGSAFFA